MEQIPCEESLGLDDVHSQVRKHFATDSSGLHQN